MDAQLIPSHVLAQFAPLASIQQLKPLGHGHINQTFLVTTQTQQFVLQALNSHVFPEPLAIIHNTQLIQTYLTEQQVKGDYPWQTVQTIPTLDGNPYYLELKKVWRAQRYLANHQVIEQISNPQQAYQTGLGFGHFSHSLRDFNAEQLLEVLPNFHQLSHRLTQFHEALKQDPLNRATDEQAFIQQLLDFASELNQQLQTMAGKLPLRVCHNDTKINNILFEQPSATTEATSSGQPLAVIDLDTCMAGYLMYDFGDMARACSTLAEDDPNHQALTVNLDYFQQLTRGFLTAWQDKLSQVELQSLLLGVQLMPCMLSLRFFTDYLLGDQYFACQYPTHNRVRAYNQLALAKQYQQGQPQLQQLFSGID